MSPLLISLGYGCQTQYIIQSIAPSFGRTPFSSSPARFNTLLKYIRGEISCVPEENNLQITLRSDGIFMIESPYFNYIHEFGGNTPETIIFTPEKINEVQQKFISFEKKWQSLDKAQKIYFFMSNTQQGFEKFLHPHENYRDVFGLRRSHVIEIRDALIDAGFSNFKLITLNGYLEDSLEIDALPVEHIHNFFYGELRAEHYLIDSFFNHLCYFQHTVTSELTLGVNQDFAVSALPKEIFAQYQDRYHNLFEIVRLENNPYLALVIQNGIQVGVIRRCGYAFVCVFNCASDAVSYIRYSGDNIYFPKGYTLFLKTV